MTVTNRSRRKVIRRDSLPEEEVFRDLRRPSLVLRRRREEAECDPTLTYDGKSFKTYYDTYDVIQVNGDRVVIGVGATVTAAVNAANLRKA